MANIETVKRQHELEKTRSRISRVLAREFTNQELGEIFDRLPDGETGSALGTLVSAVGEAWSNTQVDPGDAPPVDASAV